MVVNLLHPHRRATLIVSRRAGKTISTGHFVATQHLRLIRKLAKLYAVEKRPKN
jgi:hypothetical protein